MPELASSFLTPAPRRALAAAAALDVEIVVPVYNEAAGARAEHPPPAPLPVGRLPVRLADRRSPTTRRVDATPEIARRLAADAAERAPPAARAEGPRPRAARRLVGEHGAGRRLHGRRPLDRPARAAAAGRAADLRPQRRRHRHAARARLARRARAEARVHLARLQPPPAHRRCARAFSDAQCGFKAVRRDALDAPARRRPDEGWFFDTELLVLAQRRGLRIHEVPVDWVDDPDSRVDIVRTALDRPQGRRAAAAPAGPIARFMGDRRAQHARLRAALPAAARRCSAPPGANAAALALTAVGNTAANRRLTFGVRGREGLVRQHVRGGARLRAHARR